MSHPQQNVFQFFWGKNTNVCKFPAPTSTVCFLWKITFISSVLLWDVFARSFLFLSHLHIMERMSSHPTGLKGNVPVGGRLQPPAAGAAAAWRAAAVADVCRRKERRGIPQMMSNCIRHLRSFRSTANAKARCLLWTQAWMLPKCQVKLRKTSGIHSRMKQLTKNLHLIFLTNMTSCNHSQIPGLCLEHSLLLQLHSISIFGKLLLFTVLPILTVLVFLHLCPTTRAQIPIIVFASTVGLV